MSDKTTAPPRRRRFRRVEAKPGTLVAAWGLGNERGEPADLYFSSCSPGASSPDRRVLCEAFEGCKVFGDKTLRQELEARGYDLTTLRFSISISMKA